MEEAAGTAAPAVLLVDAMLDIHRRREEAERQFEADSRDAVLTISELAWEQGDLLLKCRADESIVPRRGWVQWLEGHGIAYAAAWRCIRIRERHEFAEIAGRSVRALLADHATRAARPTPDELPETEPATAPKQEVITDEEATRKLTVADRAMMARDAAEQDAAEARAEAASSARQADAMRRRAEAAEAQSGGHDQVAGQKVAQAESRAIDAESRLSQARIREQSAGQENRALKRRLTLIKRDLEALAAADPASGVGQIIARHWGPVRDAR